MANSKRPTSSSTMLHGAERMEAKAHPENGGAISLYVHNGGWETFSLSIFTDNADLSIELAAVINAALAKHNRLYGQLDAPAANSEAA